jgi:hypothetical protein
MVVAHYVDNIPALGMGSIEGTSTKKEEGKFMIHGL